MGNGRAGGAIMQTAAQIDQVCAARLKIINHLVTAPNGGEVRVHAREQWRRLVTCQYRSRG
jgi:hypothetical protein